MVLVLQDHHTVDSSPTHTYAGIHSSPQNDNAQAAKRLKMMLDADESIEAPSEPFQEAIVDDKESTAKAVYGVPSHYANRLLGQAYRDAYRKHNVKMEEAIKDEEDDDIDGTMEYLSDDDEAASTRQNVKTATIKAPNAQAGKADRSKLRLPGLGGNRQRNRYGRTLNQGQDIGIGVIGQRPATRTNHNKDDSPETADDMQDGPTMSLFPRSDRPTLTVPTSVGCDLPMHFKEANEPSTDFDIKQYPVTLDSDLPPLAFEHPSRVWNAMLHSLPAHLQPNINWSFQVNNQGYGRSFSIK